MDLIVIAAGRGSRFSDVGVDQPKPLVKFKNKPLFWWAAESALSSREFSRVHFVILREHVLSHSIDRVVLSYYPQAKIHVIEAVTAGAAATAAIACEKLDTKTPVAFCDCDVAFAFQSSSNFDLIIQQESSAALCVFQSSDPAYSYAVFNNDKKIYQTVEKEVASDWAICGLYVFKSATFYLDNYHKYIQSCKYEELFMSGVFNEISTSGLSILPIKLSAHLPLGTPGDIEAATKNCTESILSWYQN
jgi:NDP-sugar pyrophosphorylase family protein